jgi:hypothetical protein
VASKTTLTKDVGDPTNTCDDPEGIPKGHICVLQAVNHPCLSGMVALSCPGDSSTIVKSQKIQTHCQICGGVVSDTGDSDSREGFLEVELSWGPNSFDGNIDETTVGIFGYAVYTVNECGERTGQALTTIPAIGIDVGTQSCCNTKLYKATIITPLYPGVTSQAFMVAPLTSVGAMDVGWVTSPIVDVVPTSTTTTPAAAPAVPSKATADYRSSELPPDNLNQTSVSLANVEGAEGKVKAEEDTSPGATDSEDDMAMLSDDVIGIPVWAILAAAVGLPALLMCAYVVCKKPANTRPYVKEEEIHDFDDTKGPQQPAAAQLEACRPPNCGVPNPYLQPAAIHGAAPPDGISLPPLPGPLDSCDDSATFTPPTRTTAATQASKTKVSDGSK